ncbi:tRNA 2-thiouridine(34) synthase MnmA [Bacteroides sp. 214]|uniref:tRNA 2-thiouridine(34) synthase MnmA n=1 Tax=Bacteroides sp. 214 TaxID=2302935 RepID=UPI0013D5A332|nr:tRNA 2-thiouridine(34) synthase MnmA [Bacteroides sp. 214]NDW12091.1 tRNA 2-thiouridine(34) synthase MnmA [Bacteroides sp. 214]
MNVANKQVVLGMSGGTDSSVAAMLLQEQGYEVVGVTFRFFEKNEDTTYLRDAQELAASLQIRHIVYDARELFKDKIINYFIDEYMDARTPVPCVVCNNTLKWPLLAKIADEMGIWYIATGHYVRKTFFEGKHYIQCAVDRDKDQSFFLWGLSQEVLQRMLLPMGELTKIEARAYALQRGFAKVSTKKDSIGVCFCPFDYQRFLKEHVPAERINKGQFLDETGTFLGWHEGYPFYTIGQRRGLGIHLNRAVFVKEISKEKNEIILAPLSSLEKMEMKLKHIHIVDNNLLLNSNDVVVKIRYRKQQNNCTVAFLSENELLISLKEALTAIASGQAAAFYLDDIVLGGGIIV